MLPARPSAEELARLVSQARSVTEVLSLLGVKNTGGRRASIRRAVDQAGIDTTHFRRRPATKYTTEMLRVAVAASTSIGGVLDYLGITRSGGAHSHISRRIKAAGISTAHFTHARSARQHSSAVAFDRQILAEAADGARSMRDILRRLGLPERDKVRGEVRALLRAHGIDEPVRFRRLSLDDEAVRSAARISRSVAEMMRHLGLESGETNRRRVLRHIRHLGLDTAHFRRRLTGAASAGSYRDPAAILVRRPEGAGRSRGSALRRALRHIGVPATCAVCGVGETWHGAPLILEVDHINGDALDNRPDNLRLLCPNCHSQTPTFAGRNRGSPRR